MRILVTGITGYVGALVAQRLVAGGHDVRGFARRPENATVDVPVERGDAVTGDGLDGALRGAEVAYFLIHSMETSAGADRFESRELRAARHFARAARIAGVQRIVYLGGPVPPGRPSAHLASRLAVQRELLRAVPDSVALQASIVIGARSRSFRLLVRLVERLRVLAVPAWGVHRTAPVDERDVLSMLVNAATATLPASDTGHVYSAAGPDIVTYRQLIDRIAQLMLLDRPLLGLGGVNATPVAGVLAAAVVGEDPGLITPLMESLDGDLMPDGESAADALDIRLHTLDAAIERALREWEDSEPLAAR